MSQESVLKHMSSMFGIHGGKRKKVSYDYDGVLSKNKWVKDAIQKVKEGADVYVISARDFKDDLVHLAPKIGIPTSHIFAVHNNDNKVKKISELGVSIHYDDNPDVIDKVQKFGVGVLVKD